MLFPRLRVSLALFTFVSPAVAAPLSFNRDVRPILSDKCFACHGPDAGKRKAGLRLDRAEAATVRLESGHTAVVPGKPADSELVRRIEAADPGEVMPPPATGKSLSPAEKALLRRWIAEGGAWQSHWSFLPIAPQEPPATAGDAANPIDRFLDSRLAAEGLKPAPAADPVTLARRLGFDLTGLPPSPAEVEALARDASPDALERRVDELLASPAFGERLAVWWLDLARYADTVGYHGDQNQGVWLYRDYVIRTFNENRPFDRFTLEQIAGDLLPDATLEQKVASGYNRLAMKSAEGGVQDKEYLAKYAAERVRAVSGAWLGATFGCAECHDHKFDPFTTRDFYRFAAFWADQTERGIYSGAEGSGEWGPKIPVPTPEDTASLERFGSRIAELEKVLSTPTEALAAAQLEWEAAFGAAPEWTVLRPLTAVSEGGATLAIAEDASVLAGGKNPDADVYVVTAAAPAGKLTGLRLEALPHDSLPAKGPGRARNGNFVLTELVASHLAGGGGAPEAAIDFGAAAADHEQTAAADKNPYGRWAIAAAIDGDAKGDTAGWAILDQVGQPHEAVLETKADTELAAGSTLRIALRQGRGNKGHNLGRFRLATSTSPRPLRPFAAGVPREVAAILALDRAKRTEAQRGELAAYFRGIVPALEAQRQELAALKKERDAAQKRIPTMLVSIAREPRTMRVLPRGNWMDDSGEIVGPGVPTFLTRAAAAQDRATRIDLARWLVSRENPLTARALANRLWRLFFGSGLSRKLDDLGSQGEWPSHPELLDWLAADILESGWDIKRAVRQMVTSSAYRRASSVDQELAERDPYNRFFARQGRFRLDAEMVRDVALTASGLLTRRIGGPSARPYQPPGYWAYLNFPMREYQSDAGEEQYRRGLYSHWQRQYIHPSLLAFDAPSREECVAERVRSSTPLQALVLLNDPTYVEAAHALAARAARHGGTTSAERAAWAFREVLGRAPRPAEAQVLSELLARHTAEYAADPAAARDLLSAGQLKPPAGAGHAELAALTSAARTILNLHEAITRG